MPALDQLHTLRTHDGAARTATGRRIASTRRSWLIVAAFGTISASILGGCAAIVGGAAGAGAGYVAGHEAADDD